MNKGFREVFPGVQVESGLAELLQGVQVQRVSLNKKKDLLRIYLLSPQWIHKRYIYQLEDLIKKQLFADVPMQVKDHRTVPALRPVYAGKSAGGVPFQYSDGAETPQRFSVQYLLYGEDFFSGAGYDASGAGRFRGGKGKRRGTGADPGEDFL